MGKNTGLKLLGLLGFLWAAVGMLPQTVWAQDGQIVYYNFENMESAIIEDASGNGNDAVVRNYEDDQFEIKIAEIQGKQVNCIELRGGKTGSYLQLPENILSECGSMTVSCWVMLYTDSGYQRIWDFGNGQIDYMYLLSNGYNENAVGYACAETLEGWKEERCIQMGQNFARYEWVFTTVTIEEDFMALYLNGEQIGSRQMDVAFSEARNTKYNYIGYGQFDDVPANGCFAEFSIFNYAMTQQEIKNLYERVSLEEDVSEWETSQALYNYYINYGEEPAQGGYLPGKENPLGNCRGCAAGEYLICHAKNLQEGQEEEKEKLIELTDELARLQEKSEQLGWGVGFLSCYLPQDWEELKNLSAYPCAGYEFGEAGSLLKGLLYAYQVCEYEKCLTVAKKLADWLIDYTGEYTQNVWQQAISETWGAIGNRLYSLYEITGQEKYLTGAVKFADEKLCNQWRQGRYNLTQRKVSSVLNQAMLFWKLSKNPDCEAFSDMGEALGELWEVITEENSYASGIIGWNRYFVDEEDFIAHANSEKLDYEKDVRLLMDFTWLLYENDTEKTEYLSYMEWVLANVLDESAKEFQDFVFQEGEEAGSVLLYIDSDYVWEEKGLQFSQTVDSLKGVVTISVEKLSGHSAAEATLKFRIPEYVQSDLVVTKNQKEQSGSVQDGFVVLEKINAGDELEIQLPYEVWIGEALYESEDYQLSSIMYGPFMMVAKDSQKAETIQILNQSLKELEITGEEEPEISWDGETLIPFFRKKTGTSYFKLFIKEKEEENWYHVTINQDDSGKGTLKADCELVREGDSVTLRAYPQAGYQIYEVRADGKALEADGNNLYVVENVSGDLQIDVRFAITNPLTPNPNFLEQAATVSAHYTASWENLEGVQDAEFEPASSNVGTGKGWGDWYQQSGETVWIQYSWEVDVTVDTCEIYWYVDDSDTGTPSDLTIEYLEDGEWKQAEILSEEGSYYESDTYNTISISPIVTRDLRLVMTVAEDEHAVGIYKWKVSGKNQQ